MSTNCPSYFRWIDGNKTEKREQTRAVEWVMAALMALMEVRGSVSSELMPHVASKVQ
jgi:hypothetical protein